MLFGLIAAAMAAPKPAIAKTEVLPPSEVVTGLAAIAEEIGLEVVSTVESGGLVSVATKLKGYTCDITLTTPGSGDGAIVPKVHAHTLPGVAYATEGVATQIAEMLVPYVMQYPYVEPVEPVVMKVVVMEPIVTEPQEEPNPLPFGKEKLPPSEEINPLPPEEEVKTVPPPAKSSEGFGFGKKKGAPAPEGENKV